MTIRELALSIQQHIDKNLEYTEAEVMAEHALGFFGFYDRIIDNALEPTDRNLFYMFQDYDLLTTESEETTLWDGRDWRIHYWRFKPELKDLAQGYADADGEEEDDQLEDIYGEIPDNIWGARDEEEVQDELFG